MGAVSAEELKPMDLVRAWDQKHKGCVNKIEFRQGVRKGLGCKLKTRRSMLCLMSLTTTKGDSGCTELKEA